MHLNFDWLIVVDSLRSGIMVTDSTLQYPAGPRIIYVNHAWMQMTGYDREEIKGKTPRLLQGKHSDRVLLRSLTTKLNNREVFHGQTWNYRKNGKPFMMNWHCYAIYGEQGKPIYYVAEQQDVTEIEISRMKQRLTMAPDDREAKKFFAVLGE